LVASINFGFKMLCYLSVCLILFICLNSWESCLSCLSNRVNNLLNNNWFWFFFQWDKLNNINNSSLLCIWIHFESNCCLFLGFSLNLDFILFNEIRNRFLNFNNFSYIALHHAVSFIDYFNSFYNLRLLLNNNSFINNFFWFGRNNRFRKFLNINNSNRFCFFWFITEFNLFNFIILVNCNNCVGFLFNWRSNSFNLFSFNREYFSNLNNGRSDSWNNFLNMLYFIWCYNSGSLLSNSLFNNNWFSFWFLRKWWIRNFFSNLCFRIWYNCYCNIFIINFSNNFLSNLLYDNFCWFWLLNLRMINGNLFDNSL